MTDTGIVIVTHGDFGLKLLETASGILGNIRKCWAMGLFPGEGKEDLRKKLDTVLLSGGEFIILVDIFGGTPSNVVIEYLGHENIEAISGASLPLLLEVINQRGYKGLADLTADSTEKAKEGIIRLKDIYNKARGLG